jgi:hypothetical protein
MTSLETNIINRATTLKGVVVLKLKNVLNPNVVGDAADNEGDTVPPTLLDNTVSFKLISASMADGNNFFIYNYTLTCK